MKKSILLILSTLACVLSCTDRGEEMPRNATFKAVFGDETPVKTVLQADGSVFWNPGDAINLFRGEASARFVSDNTAPAATANFNGSLDGFSTEGDFWAVYPYSAANTFDGTTVTLTIPDQQVAVAGTFASGTFPSMARTQDRTLQFYNVCGGIKFSVVKEGITSVTFKGNDMEILAGKVKVAFDIYGKPYVKEFVDLKDEVVLSAPAGQTFQVGQWYYIVTLPANLSQGYTLSFTADQPLGAKVGKKPVTVSRSVWGQLEGADQHIGDEVGDPEYVDLGLSVNWATFNIGASYLEDKGILYAWGETASKSGFDWMNYRWAGDRNGKTFIKYNTLPGFGSVDDKTLLDPEDDPATMEWNDLWRTPTLEEWEELVSDCDWTGTEQKGVQGYLVKSRMNGNSIFLPSTDGSSFSGKYWSASLDAESPDKAGNLSFTASSVGTGVSALRYSGLGVRPVYGAVFRMVKNSQALAVGEDVVTVEVVSSLGYEVSSHPAWIHETSVTELGRNRWLHTFQADPNETGSTRNGVIVFCNQNSTCVPFAVSQENVPEPELEVNTGNLNFPYSRSEGSIIVTSNGDWTVTSDQSWCHVSPDSGSGNATVSVKADTNKDTEVRQAHVVFSLTGTDISRKVTVTQAENTNSGDFDWNQPFYHRSLFMRFTATWCGYCPIMATTVHLAQQQNPDKLEAVNIHGGGSDLVFSQADPLMDQYGIDGYPSGIVDGRRSVANYDSTYGASLIASYIQETENNYPVSSAIAFQSSLEGKELSMDLHLYIRYAGNYKVTVMVLESGIVCTQADYTNGTQYNYVHDDVARMALTTVTGDDVTAQDDLSTVDLHYDATIPAAYVTDNLKLLVIVQRAFGSQTVLSSGNYGGYYVDNAASAKAGESLSPTIEE